MLYNLKGVIFSSIITTLCYYIHTVESVLRCHIWDKEKLSSKTGDFLEEVQFIWMWHLKTGDFLKEVQFI